MDLNRPGITLYLIYRPRIHLYKQQTILQGGHKQLRYLRKWENINEMIASSVLTIYKFIRVGWAELMTLHIFIHNLRIG